MAVKGTVVSNKEKFRLTPKFFWTTVQKIIPFTKIGNIERYAYLVEMVLIWNLAELPVGIPRKQLKMDLKFRKRPDLEKAIWESLIRK